MTKKWIAVNLVLLAVAGLVAWRLYVSVTRFRAQNNPAKIQPARDPKQQTNIPAGLAPLQPARRYNPAEFQVIAAQNLFAETRNNQPEEVAPVVPVVPELRVRPILVGVTLSGNQRLASVIEPAAAGIQPADARRTQTRRLGDVYQGYTIVDITENQIVLENGPRREVIPLFDSTKQRPAGGKTPIIATRVVNFGGSGAATPGQPATTVAVGGQRQPGTPGASPAPNVNQIFGSPQAAPANAQTGTARSQAQAQQGRQLPGNAAPTAVPVQPPPAWNERTDEQGRRIIRTPFGDIIRDKPPERPPNN